MSTVKTQRPLFKHQVEGIQRLVKLVEPDLGRTLPGCLFLFDEMRMGKSRQVIEAAQTLYDRDQIDTVIVICPATVRGVWADQDLGEVSKYRWPNLPTLVVEYHAKIRKWAEDVQSGQRYLTWIVSNYEYIRTNVKRETNKWIGPHLTPLVQLASDRCMLVLDESAAISNYSALQTRACHAIRQKCSRVVLLNGTPIVETPDNIFSQARVADWRILGQGIGQYVTQYRARYAIMGGYEVKIPRFIRGKRVEVKVPTEIVGWRHRPRSGCCGVPLHVNHPVHEPGPGLEEIQEKMAPYVLRRIRSECLDLPPKLDPVTLTATLTADTWRVYKEMRDELVAWLDQQTVSVSAQAGVHVMRLAQITSGFLGGLRDEEAECPTCGGSGDADADAAFYLTAAPDPQLGLNLRPECPSCRGSGAVSLAAPPREVGREKLQVYLDWVKKRISDEPEMRMITWCRFRVELARMDKELAAVPGLTVQKLWGDQKKDDRQAGLRLMHPEVTYTGPAVLLAIIGTGGLGTNMAGAHEVVHVSHGTSLYKRQQSDDRPIGPGQTTPVSYHDIVAVGPGNQRTIDHDILKALRAKDDMARWTISAWKSVLTQERD